MGPDAHARRALATAIPFPLLAASSAPDSHAASPRPAYPPAGVSFGRGTFTLVPGQWGTIYMKLVLNTPNVTDGTVQIDFNGVTVLKYDKMNWRQTAGEWKEGLRGERQPPHALRAPAALLSKPSPPCRNSVRLGARV